MESYRSAYTGSLSLVRVEYLSFNNNCQAPIIGPTRGRPEKIICELVEIVQPLADVDAANARSKVILVNWFGYCKEETYPWYFPLSTGTSEIFFTIYQHIQDIFKS